MDTGGWGVDGANRATFVIRKKEKLVKKWIGVGGVDGANRATFCHHTVTVSLCSLYSLSLCSLCSLTNIFNINHCVTVSLCHCAHYAH